ncbi:MAG: hypothetical protein IAE77_25460 [Prosthecobacter sp.]|jgi:hypothetical protein|uniref:hypothetical protein n=1 Tax=Prosthecobacter sp. TaxID=1965333 RepID=UPI001A0E2C2D|nr:hypothetical protein [Prosthecobacter sp.]MBE2286830.1 hypothetical protein [Prosthecobacter sp.]
MFRKIRIALAVTACLLLSSCQLINTALRLAPLLMLVDKQEQQGDRTVEMRGREIEEKGPRGMMPPGRQVSSGLAFKH